MTYPRIEPATDPDADDAEAEGVVIRYRGQGGALVLVVETAPRRADHPHDRYHARCTGCLDHLDAQLLPAGLHRARDWADKHAAGCRALPQPDDTKEAGRA